LSSLLPHAASTRLATAASAAPRQIGLLLIMQVSPWLPRHLKIPRRFVLLRGNLS
jgi:hypothetical protein